MPTNGTIRTDRYRKANFDRVSMLVEKGGKTLLRVMAIREKCSMAEMFRRAILARSGLRMMPSPKTLEKLEDIETDKEARAAIRQLQQHEEKDEIIQHLISKFSPENNDAGFTVRMDRSDIYELRHAFEVIGSAMPELHISAPPVDVHLTGREIGILRRFLSNITPDRNTL